ncbi:SRPBCC domain-containing protein [Brevibacillus migulae]|uniref:SRPBCC domain-containing protein n=1 Tax=Brevibacillus migulae TaxID=1644114 RepID=UPI00106EFD4C|nr:SRPBCC domain-containing protein [Brevibacillus migulae]
MKLQVDVDRRIAKPVKEVFEAIVSPEKMSRYFISSGSGRLQEGRTIVWKWDDVGAELSINVLKAEDDCISFLWSASGVETTVVFTLTPLHESAALVRVREDGWESDEEGIKRYGQQMHGWVDMLLCMKAFLEYGINLRNR